MAQGNDYQQLVSKTTQEREIAAARRGSTVVGVTLPDVHEEEDEQCTSSDEEGISEADGIESEESSGGQADGVDEDGLSERNKEAD